jgi:hypothetical protein
MVGGLNIVHFIQVINMILVLSFLCCLELAKLLLLVTDLFIVCTFIHL